MRSVGKLVSDKQRVLLVDQEATYAAMLRHNLGTHGFVVEHVTTGQEALGRIAEIQPQLVVLD
jgi:DNA-binding response OmpR family regulator